MRDGDSYVLNGQKIWTSYANEADYCFLLARTGTVADGRDGISVFLLPLDTPGVEVRRIEGFVGAHSFNEAFLTDARVPAEPGSARRTRAGKSSAAPSPTKGSAPRGSARAARVLDGLAEWCRNAACSPTRESRSNSETPGSCAKPRASLSTV
ncbi:acyl-CoA dehydrogenase family protein [Yinghuangia aomiensis]